MTFRLAAFDMDGTILNSQNTLSEGTVRALRGLEAAGVVVVAATARSAGSAWQRFEPFGMRPPGVFCAGADVRLADGAVVRQWPLGADFLAFLAETSDREGWVTTLNGMEHTIRRQTPESANLPQRPGLRFVPNLVGVNISGSLNGLIETHAGEDAIAHRLGAWAHEVRVHGASSFDGSRLLSMTSAASDKGVGLAELCLHLGIEPHEVVTFGDGEVDVPMFEFSGYSVAMSNSPEAVRAAATFVTSSNDEDGVAAAIRRIWG